MQFIQVCCTVAITIAPYVISTQNIQIGFFTEIFLMNFTNPASIKKILHQAYSYLVLPALLYAAIAIHML